MTFLAFIIGATAEWALAGTFTATMRRLRWIPRGICAEAAALRESTNPLLQFAGTIAHTASKATTEEEFRRAVYRALHTQQSTLEHLYKELRSDVHWQVDVSQHLIAIQRDVRGMFEQLRELPGVNQASLAALTDKIGLADLTARLDRLQTVFAGGLSQLDEAWYRYWHRMRESIPWKGLRHAAAADAEYTVITSFVGRDADMERFMSFLGDEDHVLHVYGDIGCGKSRYLHECAARAELAGWEVRFVSASDVGINLSAALDALLPLLREHRPTGLLLIWDDWQGGYDDSLKTSLKPSADLPLSAIDIPLKRIVSTWPSWRKAVEDKCDRHVIVRTEPLARLDPAAEGIVALLRQLGLDDSQAVSIAAAAEGHPLALILGVDLVLDGEPLSNLTNKRSIIHRSYDKWLAALDPHSELYDIRQVALLGSLDDAELGRLTEIPGYPGDIAQIRRRFRDLVAKGFLVRQEGLSAYRLYHDLLRRHIVQSASSDDHSPFSFENVDEARSHLRPFALAPRLLDVYPLLADLPGAFSLELRRRFLEDAARAYAHFQPNQRRDLIFAMTCVNLTPAEPFAAERERIAGLIAAIAARHTPPDREIDLEWAKALHNATVGDQSPAECPRIAGLIAAVAARHTPPDREIDLRWAIALLITRMVEHNPVERQRIAVLIRQIVSHYPNDEQFAELVLVRHLDDTE